MSNKSGFRSKSIIFAAAFIMVTGLSTAANAFTFANGWSCKNHWYQMGLAELAYCHPWTS